VIDDRDVAASEAANEVLRAPPQPRRAANLRLEQGWTQIFVPASRRVRCSRCGNCSGGGCEKRSSWILRSFEQAFGMSPGRAVVRIRTEHAAELQHERVLIELLDLGPRRSGVEPVLLDPKMASSQ
jgi:hypothetical protein